MSRQSLYKSGYVMYQQEETRVIDTNELFEKKFEKLVEDVKRSPVSEIEETVSKELEPEHVARLLADGEDEIEFTEGIPAQTVVQHEIPDLEEMIANARMEAEQILEEARAESLTIKEEAKKDGWQEGIQSGYDEGIKRAMNELSAKSERLDKQTHDLQQQYSEMMDELEPMLVECITGVFEHVFKISLIENKQVISNLIANTLHGIEGSKDYIVHVSKEDYPDVLKGKEALIGACNGIDSTLEVIEDLTLSVGECMIETDGGIYDCGLGTQVEQLIRELRLLSYEGK